MRRRNIQKLGLCLTVLTLGASLEGCGKRNRAAHIDFVSGGRMRDPKDATRLDVPGDSKSDTQVVNTSDTAAGPNLRMNAGPNKMMTAEVTLRKDAILDRDFLYGSDLQYSAINDSEYELVLQSLALGHVPVRFKIFGNTLQLLADQRLNFESDINHPERLVHEFKILAQTADDVTIEITRGSPLLATVLNGPTAPRERSSWIRSLEYVSDARLLMFESSLEGADGSVLEFMETIMPREAVVPAGVKPLLADADREPMAERFRFLGAGPVYMDIEGEGRVKTQAASRYLLAADKPIEWYITPNVPDEYLPEIKTGIEGWNRYSQKMWGRDMIRFAGKLPDGVKLGDPRYNVVNWDNVAMAGAAYESQATEPLSGIQSHSLVYLPLAWINIGKDYWEKGGLSEAQSASADRVHQLLAKRSFMDRKLPVNCIEDAAAKISLEARQNPEAFAKELLKGVLMHEVGHALGLAHNFKGSLSMDLDDDSTSFSTSIMDYNQYALERSAYESVESDKGPLLEYDRQILSVLYNNAKDLEGSAVLPACENGDMDDVSNGADPLCIPYDSGKDPTEALLRTMALLQEESATFKGTRSLPRALLDASGDLGTAAVPEIDEVMARLVKHAIQVQGLVTYYVGSGAQSLNYMSRANIVSLYTTKPGIVPKGYDIDAMRSRTWTGLTYLAYLEHLPDASDAALKATFAATKTWLETTAAFKGATAEEQAELRALADSLQTKVENRLWKSRDSVLGAVRARVLGELKRIPTAPFHLDANRDYEALSLALLERQVLSPLETGDKRSLSERGSCAIALSTFKDVSEGRAAVSRVKSALESEAKTSAEPRLREEARALQNFLSPE